MSKKKKLLTWALVVSLSFSLGFVTDVDDNYFEISKNLDIFGKLYREINSLYVDDTDPSRLMRTGIDAMLNSLDPYTSYISENEIEDLRFMSTGQYGGIGALVGKRNGKILILEPYEDYPADESGIKAGDEVISVDGKPVVGDGFEVADVRNLLRGEKGSSLQLEVKRMGEANPIKLSIRRDRIRIDNVPYHGMLDEEIGYISLTGFTQDAGKEVQRATQKMKKEHPDLKGIILDLRDNPGGRLDEAVNVANVFIPQKETVVETRGRIDGSQRSHLAQRPAVDTRIPLAVLVNSSSASASEIVAGAIQDLDRGLIVGQRSFGKGLVQNIRPLSYNTQLKVTTAKYYTPSGRCIQAINYAERNADGSVARIPDSLKNAFKTRSGRTVYDGGGIEPDIFVEPESVERVTIELNRQGIIFDFATDFVNRNPQAPDAREFVITDAIYQDFMAYSQKREFDFSTRAHDQLDKLAAIVKDEAYATQLNNDLRALSLKLDAQKDKDLVKHRNEIQRLLRLEIVKRYHYQDGAIEASFADDAEITAAVEALKDGSQYHKLLKN
ncbi:MAG: S41 family peptidase [Bacteroidota bacterium]